jgi:hypothetical protein
VSDREENNNVETTPGVGFAGDIVATVDSTNPCCQPAGEKRHATREGSRAIRWR